MGQAHMLVEQRAIELLKEWRTAFNERVTMKTHNQKDTLFLSSLVERTSTLVEANDPTYTCHGCGLYLFPRDVKIVEEVTCKDCGSVCDVS